MSQSRLESTLESIIGLITMLIRGLAPLLLSFDAVVQYKMIQNDTKFDYCSCSYSCYCYFY